MQKFYTAQAHNVIQALAAAEVSFPISKKDLLAKTGSAKIQVDFDQVINMDEYCKDIKIDSFENKGQFFCALIGSTMTL